MTELDTDELFHLAIFASSKGDHEKAIVHLKAGVEREGSARFHYLLGAEHAEIGMYPRAIEDIGTALGIDPTIAEAWFQLGLLYAMSDKKDQAIAAWDNLDRFEDRPHLIRFKTAIQHYFEHSVVDAIDSMQQGLELNKTNQALNNDMIRLLQGWQENSNLNTDEEKETSESTGHYFLSAYQNKH